MTGTAVSISTGTAGMASSAVVCGSTTTNRSAPAVARASATTRAPTGSPAWVRRSCRA